MPQQRKRVNVRASGTLRNILVIDESKNGDIYIRLKSGTQVGIPPNHIKVIQDRISIHPSPKSEVYTTIKHTLELENGFKQTLVALTDAVKKRNGFTHIITHRSSDLAASVNDVKDEDSESLEIQGFDKMRFSLIFGLFVGSKESDFSTDSQNEIIHSIITRYFKIILCYTFVNLAALPISWSMKTLTFAPEIFDEDGSREAAYKKMSGDSVGTCLELFRGLTNELIVNLLETYYSLVEDDELKKSILQSIERVPRMASIRA